MMFPKEREIGSSSGLGQGEADCENLSFFKIFQGEDLSSESMRAFPYDFIRNVPQNDYSSNMVIRTQWGISWEVKVSMNPRFHYMEKRGWNQFVNDNALGDRELVTFTHTGLMCFDVSIYEENGKEAVTPRRPWTMASLSGIKKEAGESSNKDVKKAEKTGGIKKEVGESSNKDVKKAEEISESTRVAKFKSKRSEEGETSKKKKKKIKSHNVEHTVAPVFSVTITTSYLLKFVLIPRLFTEEHIPSRSKRVTIHHSDGKRSWKVLCLVRGTRATFSSGWVKLAREYPLAVGDICTFKFINPTEFHLVVSKNVEEIMSD